MHNANSLFTFWNVTRVEENKWFSLGHGLLLTTTVLSSQDNTSKIRINFQLNFKSYIYIQPVHAHPCMILEISITMDSKKIVSNKFQQKYHKVSKCWTLKSIVVACLGCDEKFKLSILSSLIINTWINKYICTYNQNICEEG